MQDLIRQVTQELTAVDATVSGKGRLAVNEVIFELHTVAVEKVGGKGGIDLRVIAVGGDVASEQTSIHKVTVKVGADNKPMYVAHNPTALGPLGTDA